MNFPEIMYQEKSKAEEVLPKTNSKKEQNQGLLSQELINRKSNESSDVLVSQKVGNGMTEVLIISKYYYFTSYTPAK